MVTHAVALLEEKFGCMPYVEPADLGNPDPKVINM